MGKNGVTVRTVDGRREFRDFVDDAYEGNRDVRLLMVRRGQQAIA